MPVPCLLQAPPPASSFTSTTIFMVLMLGVAWLILIRPLQKQRKQQDAMRAALKPGDRVLMSGGMYGTLIRIKDDRAVVRVATGVEVEFAKSAVATVLPTEDD